jgi:hypothetical protein
MGLIFDFAVAGFFLTRRYIVGGYRLIQNFNGQPNRPGQVTVAEYIDACMPPRSANMELQEYKVFTKTPESVDSATSKD